MPEDIPPEETPPVERPSNEAITDKLFDHLSADESLTDDDRQEITSALANKTKPERKKEPVAPGSGHWLEKKLW